MREAQNVVFLHPIGLDREIWNDVRRDGEIALDFPGFGSAPAMDRVTLPGLVDYVVSRVPTPATIVGLSLGGIVAQHIALRAPWAVQSLVVACSAASGDRRLLTERAAATRSLGMAELLGPTLQRWFTVGSLATPDHCGVAYARRKLLDDDPEVVASYWEAMADHDVVSSLGRITVPSTFIAGSSDPASPPELLDGISRSVQDGVFVTLAGSHMLPLECPMEFRSALDAHLRRLANS